MKRSRESPEYLQGHPGYEFPASQSSHLPGTIYDLSPQNSRSFDYREWPQESAPTLLQGEHPAWPDTSGVQFKHVRTDKGFDMRPPSHLPSNFRDRTTRADLGTMSKPMGHDQPLQINTDIPFSHEYGYPSSCTPQSTISSAQQANTFLSFTKADRSDSGRGLFPKHPKKVKREPAIKIETNREPPNLKKEEREFLQKPKLPHTPTTQRSPKRHHPETYLHTAKAPEILPLFRILLEDFTRTAREHFGALCSEADAQDLMDDSFGQWIARGLQFFKKQITELVDDTSNTAKDFAASRVLAHILADVLDKVKNDQYAGDLCREDTANGEALLKTPDGVTWVEILESVYEKDLGRKRQPGSPFSLTPNDIGGTRLGNLRELLRTGSMEYDGGPRVQPTVELICVSLQNPHRGELQLGLRIVVRFLLLFCSESSQGQPKRHRPPTPRYGRHERPQLCSPETLTNDILNPLRSAKHFQDQRYQDIIDRAQEMMKNGGTVAQMGNLLFFLVSESFGNNLNSEAWSFLSSVDELCRVADPIDAEEDREKFVKALDNLSKWFRERHGNEQMARRRDSMFTPASGTSRHSFLRNTPASATQTEHSPLISRSNPNSHTRHDLDSSITRPKKVPGPGLARCPYTDCNELFRGDWTQGNLNRHVKFKHDREKQNKEDLLCKYCEQEFQRPDNARKHEQKCHRRPSNIQPLSQSHDFPNGGQHPYISEVVDTSASAFFWQ